MILGAVAQAARGVSAFRPASIFVDYVVVAGGGGSGGAYNSSWSRSGGGGAGGVLSSERSGESQLEFFAGDVVTVTIGAGGSRNHFDNFQPKGGNSLFGPLTALGGGSGTYGRNLTGGTGSYTAYQGSSGGSGGGGSAGGSYTYGYSGTAGQGHDGASMSGGGGGANQAGSSRSSSTVGGKGGDGLGISFVPTSFQTLTGAGVTSNGVVYFGGGGAGGGGSPTRALGGGATGSGTYSGNPGYANCGGGASGVDANGKFGGNGGSGVVIIRFKTALSTPTVGAGLTYQTATDGEYTLMCFKNGSDTVTF